MPYVSQKVRDHLDAGGRALNAGELNYRLTRIALSGVGGDELEYQLLDACLNYLGPSPQYRDFNDAIGALICCAAEAARRRPRSILALELGEKAVDVAKYIYKHLVAPYEDRKIAENGDVYGEVA